MRFSTRYQWAITCMQRAHARVRFESFGKTVYFTCPTASWLACWLVCVSVRRVCINKRRCFVRSSCFLMIQLKSLDLSFKLQIKLHNFEVASRNTYITMTMTHLITPQNLYHLLVRNVHSFDHTFNVLQQH